MQQRRFNCDAQPAAATAPDAGRWRRRPPCWGREGPAFTGQRAGMPAEAGAAGGGTGGWPMPLRPTGMRMHLRTCAPLLPATEPGMRLMPCSGVAAGETSLTPDQPIGVAADLFHDVDRRAPGRHAPPPLRSGTTAAGSPTPQAAMPALKPLLLYTTAPGWGAPHRPRCMHHTASPTEKLAPSGGRHLAWPRGSSAQRAWAAPQLVWLACSSSH